MEDLLIIKKYYQDNDIFGLIKYLKGNISI